jgi:crossover junction endodeoxyribonuclease RuvC
VRILGVDPGCDSTGYGIIETDGSRHASVLFGAIRTSTREPFHERLLKIHTGLCQVLDREPVDAVAVEQVFHSANVKSALRLGHARGAVLVAAAGYGRPVFEYSALEIKSAIVGYGRAEKHQVQGMVKVLLALPELPSPDDAADALAVAICHSHVAATRALVERAAQLSGTSSPRTRPRGGSLR